MSRLCGDRKGSSDNGVSLLCGPAAGACGLQHKAFLALASGQSSKAAELFREALKLDPTNIGCATNMALSELYNRQLPKAVEALETVRPFPANPTPSALRSHSPPFPHAAGCSPRIPKTTGALALHDLILNCGRGWAGDQGGPHGNDLCGCLQPVHPVRSPGERQRRVVCVFAGAAACDVCCCTFPSRAGCQRARQEAHDGQVGKDVRLRGLRSVCLQAVGQKYMVSGTYMGHMTYKGHS